MTTLDTGPTARTLWRPVLLVWLILLTLGFGITVAMTPQTRIYEDIICRRYYADHPEQSTRLGIAFSPSTHQQQPQSRPDESLCKKPAIQDAVNSLFGWQTFFDGIPGLLLAMYYGSLADTWGRRPVLILSLVGQLLGAAWILLICWIEADVRLTWLSSIFSCVGGGNTVFTAAAMMILADAAPDAVRTRIFFYASTCLVVGEMVGPPVGAALMAKDPWIPNMIGFLCMGLATALAFLMNETLVNPASNTAANRPPPEAAPPRESPSNTGYLPTLARGLKTVLHHATSTLRFVAHDRNLILLVGAYFTVDFARETLSLLVRYVSVRFSIPLAQASYLLSFRASGHLLASAVLLPVFDALLARKFRAAPMKKDLVMARVSIGFVTTGFAGLVLAPGVVAVCVAVGIYTLGSGFQAATKSLLGAMVDKSALGTVFTLLSLMDTVGALFAGPIDALIMKRALRMEGVWKGLPFMFALVCCAVSTFALAYVKPKSHVVLEEAEDEERRSFLGAARGGDGDGRRV